MKLQRILFALTALLMLVSSFAAGAAPVATAVVETTHETVFVETAETAGLSAETVFAAKPADYDEEKGQLVYFTNFDTASTNTNLANVVATHYDSTLVETEGKYTVLPTRHSTACGVCFTAYSYDMVITNNSAESKCFVYTDGTPIKGKVQMVAEVADLKQSKSGTMSTFSLFNGFNRQFSGLATTAVAGGYKNATKVATVGTNDSGFITVSTGAADVTDDINDFNRIGLSSSANSWCKPYYSYVALYVKDPANALWLVDGDGENREYVVVSGDTYTFPSKKDGTSVTNWTDGTNIYNAGQTVSLSDVAAKTFSCFSYAPSRLNYSVTYGQMLYYNNFKDEVSLLNVSLHGAKAASPVHGMWASKASHLQDFIFPWTTGIEIVSAKGTENAITYADGTPVKGDIQLVASAYNPGSAFALYPMYDVKGSNDSLTSIGNGFYDASCARWIGGATNPDFTNIASTVYSNDGTLKRVGFHPGAVGSAKETYYSFISLYIKNPENALWLTNENDGEREFIVISEESYTFPSVKGETPVTMWTDGEGYYSAGASFAVSEVTGKTFKPCDVTVGTKPADYIEGKGMLVYYNTFNPADKHENLVNIDVSHIGQATVLNGTNVVLANRDSNNPCGTCFNQWSYEMLFLPENGTAFTYADGTPVKGKITFSGEVVTTKAEGFNIHSVYNVPFENVTDEKKYADGYKAVAVNEALSEFTTIYSLPVDADAEGFNKFSFSAEQGSTNNTYYTSVAVYVIPDDGLWLVDEKGENREFVKLDGEFYSFPEAKNGTYVEKWTDGVNVFVSGTAYEAGTIGGKTYRPIEYSPITLDKISMRTESSQGIRVASFVNTAVRNEADEYGYVVALATSFADNDYTTLTLDNDSIKKVSGVSYIKHGNTDKIYIDARTETSAAKDAFGDAALDEYGIYFTGVVTGIPELKEAYTAKLVIRAYVKVGDAYYYGTPKVNSVYDAALVVKAAYEKNGAEVPEFALRVIEVATKE